MYYLWRRPWIDSSCCSPNIRLKYNFGVVFYMSKENLELLLWVLICYWDDLFSDGSHKFNFFDDRMPAVGVHAVRCPRSSIQGPADERISQFRLGHSSWVRKTHFSRWAEPSVALCSTRRVSSSSNELYEVFFFHLSELKYSPDYTVRTIYFFGEK